ncbi:hypothetical protein [Thiothrix fructosivorans]|uniref:Uncharacterized protein n=1 Tax=Thiothrix fructosivorans TaxID=111770 RepID=A0A8B0SSW6_9GAMM|nr:hypothetical protein [Thiothrix fructosivorans]MBO0612521.1 hypothetical protein [Thiothrix fructosivorans]QTX12002.1 hypothetical protein J1836_006630 [Thiothrix fructosivorans]
MKNQYWTLSTSTVLLALLTACGGGSGSNAMTETGNGSNTGGTTSTSASRVQVIANAPMTAQATDVTDPAGLQQDLISVFGAADSNPVPVNSGDTVQTLISRAAGQ